MELKVFVAVLCILVAGAYAQQTISYVVMSTPQNIIVNQDATFGCRAVAVNLGNGDPTLEWLIINNLNKNDNRTLTGATVQDFNDRPASDNFDGYRQEEITILIDSTLSVNYRISCTAELDGLSQEVYAFLNRTAASLGESCTSNALCSVANSYCTSSSICACSPGYRQLGTNQCIGSTANLNEACGSSTTCAVTNSECSSTTGRCQCRSGYAAVGTTQCILITTARIGEQCGNTITCSVQNSQCSSTTGTGTCVCRSGYYAVNQDQCTFQSSFGQQCTRELDSCRTTNADCAFVSGTAICTCPSGFEYASSTDSCNQVTTARIGEQCGNTITCSVQNSQCSSTTGTGTCVCRSGYYAVNQDQCTFQSSFGQQCTRGLDSCRTTNADCAFVSGTAICTCPSGFEYASSTDSCNQVTTARIGEQCGNTISCSVQNSQCSSTTGTGTCVCRSGYYAFGSDQCIFQSSFGQQCRQGYDSCYTTNADCAFVSGSGTTTCTCPSGFEYVSSTDSCNQVTSANLGQSCGGSVQCTVGNSECRNSFCFCRSTYIPVGTTECRQPYLGESCVSNNCLDTSTSSSNTVTPVCSTTGSSVCVCPTGYYGFNNICYRKITLGNSCNAAASSPCADNNAECTGSPNTCGCRSGYINTNNVCSANIPSQCPSNTQYDVVTQGTRNPTSPDIYIGATCYVVELYRAKLMPCVDVTPSNQIQLLRSGGWEKLGSNGQFSRINGSTAGLINGDYQNTNLTVSNAQAEFAGTYRCHLCYGTDSVIQCTNSPDVTLIVDGIQTTPAAPEITNTALSISGTPIKGQSLTMTCSTSPPNVATNFVWRRNNVPLGVSSSTLTIGSVSLLDAGSYTCTASNNVVFASAVTSDPVVVTVQYQPEFSLPGGGSYLTVNRNLDTTSAVLNCANYMNAEPAITNYRFTSGSTQLYSGPSGQFEVTSTEGYGDYVCTATNAWGNSNPPLTFGVQQGGGPNVGAATEGDGGISTGAIAAIVLGIIFLLLLILIIVVCCCNYGWCRKKEKVEPEVIVAPPVKPYIPRSIVNTDQASTVSRKDVGIMMNGTHRPPVSTEYEEPYTPRYYLKPANESGPIISMFEDHHNQPRAHQLPALDTQYLYREEEPKKKRRRRKKRTHKHEAPAPEPETPRYAEVQPPQDDDLVVIPGGGGRNVYYE